MRAGGFERTHLLVGEKTTYVVSCTMIQPRSDEPDRYSGDRTQDSRKSREADGRSSGLGVVSPVQF
jgi:hypothetical protein